MINNKRLYSHTLLLIFRPNTPDYGAKALFKSVNVPSIRVRLNYINHTRILTLVVIWDS